VSDETTSLVEGALRARRGDAYRRRVARLHGIGGREMFEAARRLLRSGEAARRALGADILSGLDPGRLPPPFQDESVALLLPAVEVESDPTALAAVVRALARHGVRRAIPALVGLVDHEAVEVRLGLAAELHWCTWQEGVERPDGAVTAALIRLSADRIAEVRNWACFNLAQSDVDGEEVRAALWRRSNDRHHDTRMEALAGLARRRDDRVGDVLLRTVERLGAARLGAWIVDDLVAYARERGDERLLCRLT